MDSVGVSALLQINFWTSAEIMPLGRAYQDSPRKIKIGNMEIILKRTSNKHMAVAGKISGLIIQALLYFGKEHLDKEIVMKLSRRLSPQEKKELIKGIKSAPIWMRAFLKNIAGG